MSHSHGSSSQGTSFSSGRVSGPQHSRVSVRMLPCCGWVVNHGICSTPSFYPVGAIHTIGLWKPELPQYTIKCSQSRWKHYPGEIPLFRGPSKFMEKVRNVLTSSVWGFLQNLVENFATAWLSCNYLQASVYFTDSESLRIKGLGVPSFMSTLGFCCFCFPEKQTEQSQNTIWDVDIQLWMH